MASMPCRMKEMKRSRDGWSREFTYQGATRLWTRCGGADTGRERYIALQFAGERAHQFEPRHRLP